MPARLLPSPVKSSVPSLDSSLAAPLPVLARPGRAKVSAFLFNIGEDAEQADKFDQETDQAEIQEETKSVMNAESGYDSPLVMEKEAHFDTPISVGDADEIEQRVQLADFEDELEPGKATPLPLLSASPGARAPGPGPGAAGAEPEGPSCSCPEWDPMKTALPEDLQHASLTMLQRRTRPENRVAPSLREAAASVERAGRLFEGWVRRRQQLAEVLPELSVKMQYCRNRAKDFASSAAENALRALKERVDEGAEEEEEAEQQEEMAQGQMAFEAIGEAQSDFNEWAQEEDAGLHHQPNYLDQASFLASRGQGAAKALHSSFQNFPAGQSPEQLAQAMGQIYGKPAAAAGPEPMMGHGPEEPMAEEAAEPSPSQEEALEAQEEEEDVLQAEEVEDFGDFFRECGEFRIPATVLAARRAANEAYWAFDRAMMDAEKKVGLAIQHAVVRGA